MDPIKRQTSFPQPTVSDSKVSVKDQGTVDYAKTEDVANPGAPKPYGAGDSRGGGAALRVRSSQVSSSKCFALLSSEVSNRKAREGFNARPREEGSDCRYGRGRAIWPNWPSVRAVFRRNVVSARL